MAEKKEKNFEEEMNVRVQNFDREFQDLQKKYQMKAVAEVHFPGGAALVVPITLVPWQAMPIAPKEELTKAEE